MIHQIPEVLKPEEAAALRRKLLEARWLEGAKTAGVSAAPVKTNRELDRSDPFFEPAVRQVLDALARSRPFTAKALPLTTSTPYFNRYEKGQSYGLHYDNALGPIPGRSGLMRADLSATLFLSDQADYDGGELSVEDTYGFHQVKLPAGHLVVYSAGALHEVKPVTRGERVACFFWIQSLVHDEQERAILADLDNALALLSKDHPRHEAVMALTRGYNHLLRKWSEV
ncbi:MAG TPA: Fe2+-dependent dioxygenase [bacterium]|nr:Fe2+-dependent dioxygenase [bacterium]